MQPEQVISDLRSTLANVQYIVGCLPHDEAHRSSLEQAAQAIKRIERILSSPIEDPVGKALHDIKWVDSSDYGSGDENEAIRACLAGSERLRAAAEEARRVLSMPLLMKGDAPVAKALKMLDEALGKQEESKT